MEFSCLPPPGLPNFKGRKIGEGKLLMEFSFLPLPASPIIKGGK